MCQRYASKFIGKHFLFDCWEYDKLTVVNPLQQELVDTAATTAGHALSYAFNWKVSRGGVGAACQREGLSSFLSRLRRWEAGMRQLCSRSGNWQLPSPGRQGKRSPWPQATFIRNFQSTWWRETLPCCWTESQPSQTTTLTDLSENCENCQLPKI